MGQNAYWAIRRLAHDGKWLKFYDRNEYLPLIAFRDSQGDPSSNGGSGIDAFEGSR
jgi:hypothetical protein